MTDPIPADRLAELRRMLADETWELPAKQDVTALIGEIDRLTAENEQLASSLANYRRGPHPDDAYAHGFAQGRKEADDEWRPLRDQREQLIAALLRLKQQPGISRDAWFAYAAALEMARGTRIEFRGPHADAEALAAASVMDFPSEAANEAQRRAEGFEWEYGYQNMDRKIDKTPMMIGRSLEDIGDAMRRHREYAPEVHYALRRRRVGPWETMEDESVLPPDLSGELDDLAPEALAELKRISGLPAPTDGRLYADGPPCRHDMTWLVATELGIECMVCGPAESPSDGLKALAGLPVPDGPQTQPQHGTGHAHGAPGAEGGGTAPEDEGIASADVHAQIGADNESERRPRELYGPTGHSSPDAAHYVIHGTLADGTYPWRDTTASLKPTDDESEPQ